MATTGYASALGGLAKDAVIGAGKGFVGGLKGAMMSEAPGIVGAYAFGKELRKRAGASKMPSGGSAPPSANKSSSSSSMAGGLGITNDKSIVAGLRQSNIINLEQIRQLKQLNNSVINQSKLLKFTIDDTKRKDQFAEEVANEQAIRDDKLLEAIRNIGSGGRNGKRGGGDAANDSSSGGFLSSLLGGAAGGAASNAISKLVPLLSAAMAALPWAKILKFAGPAGLAAEALSIPGSTQTKETEKKQAEFAAAERERLAQERAAEDAKAKPRPLDYVPGEGENSGYSKNKSRARVAEQENWDKTERGRRNPVDGKLITGAAPPPYNLPVGNGEVTSRPGQRLSKTTGMSTFHQGVDISSVLGSPVNSIAPGTVIEVDKEGSVPDINGHKKGLGRFVTIDHGNGIISKYGHLSVVSVNKGDKVGPGVPLGKSGGNTEDRGSGATTGAHLHLETTKDKIPIDPASLPGLVGLGKVGNSMQGRATQAPASQAAVGAPLTNSAAAATPNSSIQRGADGILPAGTLGNQDARNARLKAAGQLPQHQSIGSRGDMLEEAKGRVTKYVERIQKLTPEERKARKPAIDAAAKELRELADRSEKLTPEKAANLLKDIQKFLDKYDGPATTPVVPKNVVSSAPNSDAFPSYNVEAMIPDYLKKQPTLKEGTQFASLNTGILSDAGPGKQPVFFDLNAGDSARDIDRFNKIENRRINEKIAEIEEQRKRLFLTSEKSSYGNNTAVEVSKESNPFVTFIEKFIKMFLGERGERSSPVKLDPSYFDNMHVNDLFRKTERDFRVASGTKIKDGKPINTYDEELNKKFEEFGGAKFGSGGPAKLLPTTAPPGGNQLPTKVIPPFKPDYKSNTEILAEANKQFLKELRSTFTGLARQGLKDALLPNGVGVSFKQATQDNLFRGQQLKIINDTTKKINVAAVDLLGKKYGPMFAPMLDKLSTSYFEVGSRLVGRQLFTRFGELDAKETMGITGQVLGNIAAGKKQLAFEQVLFGMSGGRERGIALNAESLFAKYGFEDSQQGISYFADVLGEKATQPFSKVFGADDRNKSIVRDPRTGKSVYVDSGKEASKKDIEAGYGGRISQSSMLGETNEHMEVPGYPGSVAGTGGSPADPRAILNDKGEVIGRKAVGLSQSSVTGGNISAPASRGTGGGGTIKQILNADPKDISRNTVFGTTEAERIEGGDALRAKEDTYIRAEVQKANLIIQNQKDLAKAAAKSDYEAAIKVAETEADRAKANNAYNRTLTDIETSTAIHNADKIVDKLDKGTKGADGTTPEGLKASGRRPGQLFDANVYDKAGKIEGKDPMKEIGNFGFDILKLGVGSELTKDISNPYMQTITNFAIQKGMNYAVDSIMKSDIFSTMGSAAASSGGGGYGGAASSAWNWVTSLFGFKTGGLVRGPGTGKSDSIPAMLSAGEFVINAEATKRNLAVLNAINASTLKKADTKKTIKSDGSDYTDSGGPGGGQDPTSSSWSDLTNSQKAAYFDVNPNMAKLDAIVDTMVGFTTFGSIMNFFDPTGKNERAAIRGGFQTYSDFKSSMGAFAAAKADAAKFSGLTGKAAKDSELDAEKAAQAAQQNSTGKTSWGKTGDVAQDIGGTAPAAPNISVDPSTGLAPGELSQSSSQSTAVADIATAVAVALGVSLDTGLASGIGGGEGGTSANSGADGEGCVDPATLILLANGTKIPAGKLKVGDFLHTLHEDTFVYDDFEVVYVKTVQQPKNIVTFTDGHNLTASDSHKFLMSNRTWKRVDALEAGDTIETAKGVNSDGFKTVAKIEAIGLGDVVKLTIDNAHTYVSEGLVSHNKDLAKGGLIRGPGTGISDSIPAMLSDGEYVINAKATKANLALLKSINSRSSSGSTEELAYNKTLYMKPFESIVAVKKYATGGLVARNNNMNAVAVPTNRSQYILSPPTNNSSSENQNNSSNMIIGPKTSTSIDNSSVTNFYNQASGMIDSIRSVTPQMA